MGADAHQDWKRAVASALEWWHDAGVDTLADPMPRDWTARIAPPPVALAAAPAPAAAPARAPRAVAAARPAAAEKLPSALEPFLAWRTGPAAPETDWTTPLCAPEGPVDAPLVVLTDMPEPDAPDCLLGGAAGRLFERMLAAIGLSRESVHIVPFAFARPFGGQVPADAADRLAALARHHLGLLRPAHLLMFGHSASRALAAADGWPPENRLHSVNDFGTNTSVVIGYPPRFLLERPLAKADAWKQLLLLSRGMVK